MLPATPPSVSHAGRDSVTTQRDPRPASSASSQPKKPLLSSQSRGSRSSVVPFGSSRGPRRRPVRRDRNSRASTASGPYFSCRTGDVRTGVPLVTSRRRTVPDQVYYLVCPVTATVRLPKQKQRFSETFGCSVTVQDPRELS